MDAEALDDRSPQTHLNRVTETPGGTSQRVAAGPAGLTVEWEAEVINEKENQLLAPKHAPRHSLTGIR
jgi:uncharacterized membrane protein